MSSKTKQNNTTYTYKNVNWQTKKSIIRQYEIIRLISYGPSLSSVLFICVCIYVFMCMYIYKEFTKNEVLFPADEG